MIEDLQDELQKNEKKSKSRNTNHTFMSVIFVWLIVAIVFFLFCLPGIKNTFRNKTKNQIIQEAKEYAQRVETRPMQLFYVSEDGLTLKPFTVKVAVTGAGAYNDAIEGLLADTPSEVLQQLCINSIPKGTVLKSVQIEKNKALVSLSAGQDYTDYDYSLAKQQIQNTLKAINSEITDFAITVNNKQI